MKSGSTLTHTRLDFVCSLKVKHDLGVWEVRELFKLIWLLNLLHVHFLFIRADSGCHKAVIFYLRVRKMKPGKLVNRWKGLSSLFINTVEINLLALFQNLQGCFCGYSYQVNNSKSQSVRLSNIWVSPSVRHCAVGKHWCGRPVLYLECGFSSRTDWIYMRKKKKEFKRVMHVIKGTDKVVLRI